MQDYGDEVKDFFTVDKQLAAELEYDMRRYQEQLAEQQQPVRRAAPGAPGSRAAGGRRPCPSAQRHPTPTLRPPVSGAPSARPFPVTPTLLESRRVPVREVRLPPDSPDSDGVLAPSVAESAVPPSPSLGRLLPRKPGQPRGLCARQCRKPGSDMVLK